MKFIILNNELFKISKISNIFTVIRYFTAFKFVYTDPFNKYKLLTNITNFFKNIDIIQKSYIQKVDVDDTCVMLKYTDKCILFYLRNITNNSEDLPNYIPIFIIIKNIK